MNDTVSQADQATTAKPQPRPVVGRKTAAPPMLVAIDDGLAQMKLCAQGPDGIVTWKGFTAIRPASSGAMLDLSAGEALGMYETEEGERYVCSSTTRAEETRFPDFHVSRMNRVLIHNSLIEAGYADRDLLLLTSLPVDEYFVAGQVNRDRSERKRQNLLRTVERVPAAGPMPRIADVRVGCQAIAAFFDLVLDETGAARGETPESVAVVDIGGSTLDIAVVVHGRSIDEARSGAARIGVLDVHAGLRRRLTRHFNVEIPLSPAAIDRAVRSGEVKVWGKPHDISGMIAESVEEVGHQMVREIDRKIGNGATLDQVLFVGGGAALFRDVVGNWRNTYVPDQAEFANARGLLKYALRRG